MPHPSSLSTSDDRVTALRPSLLRRLPSVLRSTVVELEKRALGRDGATPTLLVHAPVLAVVFAKDRKFPVLVIYLVIRWHALKDSNRRWQVRTRREQTLLQGDISSRVADDVAVVVKHTSLCVDRTSSSESLARLHSGFSGLLRFLRLLSGASRGGMRVLQRGVEVLNWIDHGDVLEAFQNNVQHSAAVTRVTRQVVLLISQLQ